MKPWVLLATLLVLAACTPAGPTQPSKVPGIELGEDLSAAEFQRALVGRWESVYAYEGKPNVQHLGFGSRGQASLLITHDGGSVRYSGPYSVDFDREPGAGSVTLATITIGAGGSEPVVLSRVNFGLHSGVPLQEGVVLRIDGEAQGVLKRAD
jgi:hypothetical protein